VRDLIDHQAVMPYLIELLGPKLRLDHDYGMFMQKRDGHGGLHGGHGGSHWYRFRNGRMENGLTVVTYFLTDAPAGAGGFCCVPGSHKSNYSVTEIPQAIKRFEQDAHYVVQPAVEAGDVFIFTESTIHGTLPWQADHERRNILFKYSPGYSTWALNYYDTVDLGGLTSQQKRMIVPPSIENHEAVVNAV